MKPAISKKTPSNSPLLALPLAKAPLIFVILVWSMFSVAIICFFMFSRTGDHLPALSETGIYPPQRYIFTLAMTLVGGGILALAVFLHLYYGRIIDEKMPVLTKITKKDADLSILTNLYFSHGFLALCGILFAGLGIVPIIEPTEEGFSNWFQRHSIPIHLGCTGLGFLCGMVHMALAVKLTQKIGELFTTEEEKEEKEKWLALAKKRNMCIYGVFVVMIVLGLWSGYVSMACGNMQIQGDVLFEPAESLKCWPQRFHKQVVGAVAQYALIACVCWFFTTYEFELSRSKIAII